MTMKTLLGARSGFRARLGIWAILLLAIIMAGFAPSSAAEGHRSGALVFGGSVHVAAGETADGSVVSFGGPVTVDGTVNGSAISFGGPVTINGTVNGTVASFGGTVTLSRTARVYGDVTSVGGSIIREPGALVTGSVGRTTGLDRFHPEFPWFWAWAWGWPVVPGLMLAVTLMRLIGALVLSLVIVAIWPTHSQAVAQAINSRPGRVAAAGVVSWLLLIPGVILLLLTLVGIALIPLWLLLFVAAGAMGRAALALLVGQKVAKLANADIAILPQVVIGSLIISLLGWVPWAGWLAGVAVAIFGVGAVLETRFGTNKPWWAPRQPAPPQP